MFEFLVGDFAIVVGATLVCVCAWRIFPFAVRRIIHDEPTRRSYINRAFLAAGGAAIIWIAVFDNWRQVLGIPTGWIQDEKSRIASDPFYSGDVADPVRAVSWILFLTAVAGGAYFFARFSRGWLEPLTLGPVAAVLFYVLNTFRLRFDVDSVRIAYGTIESPLDVALTLMWIALLMVTMGLLVLGMYLVAWSPATLVFSVIYRRFINPQDREEPPIFRKLREERTMTEMHGGQAPVGHCPECSGARSAGPARFGGCCAVKLGHAWDRSGKLPLVAERVDAREEPHAPGLVHRFAGYLPTRFIAVVVRRVEVVNFDADDHTEGPWAPLDVPLALGVEERQTGKRVDDEMNRTALEDCQQRIAVRVPDGVDLVEAEPSAELHSRGHVEDPQANAK